MVYDFVCGTAFGAVDPRRAVLVDGLNEVGDEWSAEVFCGRQCLGRLLAVDLDDEFVAVEWTGNEAAFGAKDGELVGVIRADIIIDGKWVIELKACPSIKPEHVIQTMHYMERVKAIEGYVINFPNKPGAEGPEIKKLLLS